MAIFKYHQNTPCGYSKLVPEDAWQDAKGFRSIWSFHPEKTSKMAQNGQFSPHFGRFLRTEWLELAWFIFWKKNLGAFWHHFNHFCYELGSWGLYLPSNEILTFWNLFWSWASAKPKCGPKFYTYLNLAKHNLILEEKMKFEMRSGRGSQNGQKWPQNGPKWSNNKMYYFGLNYLLENP